MSLSLVIPAVILGLLALTLAQYHRHIVERRRAVRRALLQWLDQNQRRRALSGLERQSPALESLRLQGLPEPDWRALHLGERGLVEEVGHAGALIEAAHARVDAVAEVLAREIAAHNVLIDAGVHRAVARLMGLGPIAAEEAS